MSDPTRSTIVSAFAPQIMDAALKTRRTGLDDLIHLDPQQVFDLLPDKTRESIDLEDFKDVLATVHLMFVDWQHRQIDKFALEHQKLIWSVDRELDA